jgi:hypothetical protein
LVKAFELLDGRLLLADVNDIQHTDGRTRSGVVPEAAVGRHTGRTRSASTPASIMFREHGTAGFLD